MSKSIDYFFSKKKISSDLPNSSEFLNQKLIDKSKESESPKENTNKCNDNSVEDLKKKLCEANNTIKRLNEVVAKQKNDIKLLKCSLNASNRLCVSKDLKIERLIKEKKTSQIQKPCEDILYRRFDQKINAAALNELRKVTFGQNYDSSFILKLVRHLYEKDLKVLLTKSCTGSKSKAAITPTKKSIITDIFRERIVSEESEEARIEFRINRVGALINDAINNICRPLKAAAKSSTSTALTAKIHTSAITNTSASTNKISAEPPPLAPIAKKRKLV